MHVFFLFPQSYFSSIWTFSSEKTHQHTTWRCLNCWLLLLCFKLTKNMEATCLIEADSLPYHHQSSDNEKALWDLTTHLIMNISGRNVSPTYSYLNQLEWRSQRGMCCHVGSFLLCFPRMSEPPRQRLCRALIVQSELSGWFGVAVEYPDIKTLKRAKTNSISDAVFFN